MGDRSLSRALATLDRGAHELAAALGHRLGPPITDGLWAALAYECQRCNHWCMVRVPTGGDDDLDDPLSGAALRTRCPRKPIG